MIDKKRVKQGFGKSATTYRKYAVVQDFIADRLMSELHKHIPKSITKTLEIGCGPGILTQKMISQFHTKHYWANDIVEDHNDEILEINNQIHFLPGDIESITLPGELDLVISSSTFQWLHNLDLFLTNLYHHISDNGILAFTTFGPENYREIRMVEGSGLDYLSWNNLSELLSHHYNILWSDKEIITRHFETPRQILQHMKLTGVNGIPGKVWTPSRLKRFQSDYIDMFGTPMGVPLTYQPFYFILSPKK